MINKIKNNDGQYTLELGQKLRDKGIQQAVDHANIETENWSENAYRFLLEYIKTKINGRFMAEDAREASAGIVPEPPSKRAWGGIIVRAVRSGKIKRAGFMTVKNEKAHCTPATLWEIIK